MNIVSVKAKKFLLFCTNLEEELPIVKITREIDLYFNNDKETNSIKTITETFTRRYKNIEVITIKANTVLIDTVWEVIEYYFDFNLIFGAKEKYRIDIFIQRKIVEICMKNKNNHKWLKRQYELASMSRIGYEIYNSDYEYDKREYR